ncbi:MAG: HD domain-containing phosphohydrolase [Vulcanimicrobiota bacterium]
MSELFHRLKVRFITPTILKSFLVTSSAVLFSILLYSTCFLKQLDYYWLNYISLTYSLQKSPEHRLTFIEISDRTYELCGSPVPRPLYLKCLKHLEEMGAKVKIVDVFLRAGNEHETDAEIVRAGTKDHNSIFIINKDGTTQNFVEPLSSTMTEEPLILSNPLLNKDNSETSEIIRSVTAYLPKHGREIGATDLTVDGISKNAYYTISLLAVARYLKKEIEILPGDPPGKKRPFYLPTGRTIRIGDRIIYLAENKLYLNYPRTRAVSIDTFDFEQIIDDNYRNILPKEAFQDRIVILGNTSAFYHDVHRTPLGPRKGSEIHGFFISNILDNELLYHINSKMTIVLIIIIGLIAFLAFPRLKPLPALSVFLISLLAIILLSIMLFRYGRLFLDISPLLLVIMSTYPLLSLFKVRETELELSTGLAMFDRMSVLDRNISNGSQWIASILSLSCTSINAHCGWIQLLDSDKRFSLSATYNTLYEKSPENLDGGLCRKALSQRNYLLSRNKELEEELSAYEKVQDCYNILCLPLMGSSGAIGVVAFGKKFLDDFRENQIRQVMAIALVTGAFIDNVNLNRKIEMVFLEAITSLAQAIDARDPYTYGHSKRVSEISREIATIMEQAPEEIHRIAVAGIVHDVGKIGVPESILHKPGKLSDEEFTAMKKHPEIAVKILEPLEQFYSLLPLVEGHHEKLNGKGYPQGLVSDEIPFGAKILAVADIYDALTSDRPYRKASTPGEALALMENQFKGDLDEDVLKALKRFLRESNEIQQ